MEEFEFDKNLKNAITAEERKRQKVYLQSVESSIQKPMTKKINWWVAASIAIIIGLGGYFAFSNGSISNQELYAEYFTPYRNTVVPIVRNDTKPTKKATAFEKYETGKYGEAIALFNQLTAKDSIDTNTLNFYKANAHLKLNEFKKARSLLLKVILDKKSQWKEESLWYFSLASLKLNEEEIAKEYLLHLKNLNQKGFKRKEVKDLLNALD